MTRKGVLITILLSLLAGIAQASERVVLLVDVSGSMRTNDPLDRRIDAAKLLIEMFPADTMAGIAMFDGEATVLVPLTPVDAMWRRAAASSLAKIHSRGQRTNFLTAIEHARDALQSDGHIILLTDGALDVDHDAEVNKDARKQLINDHLADLSKRKIQLHSLGLGSNLDTSLMRQMGQLTQGSYAAVESASQLSRLFGKTIDNIAPPIQLAIRGEYFNVDPFVNEFTALLFHREGSQIVLRDPHGNVARSLPSARLFEGPDFTMFTVTKPTSGRWHIDYDGGIEGRVSILSDLALKVELGEINQELPLNIALNAALIMGESIPQDASLKAMVQVKGELYSEGHLLDARVVAEPNSEGVYPVAFAAQKRAATYQVEVLLDGRTFERLWRKEIQFDPLILVNRDTKGEVTQIDIALAKGDTSNARVFAVLNDSQRLVLTPNATGWSGSIQTPPGSHQLLVEVDLTTGERYSQRILFVIDAPVIEPEPVVEEVVQLPDPEPVAPVQQSEPVAEASASWVVWAIMIGGNAGLILILVGLWRMFWTQSARAALAAVRANLKPKHA